MCLEVLAVISASLGLPRGLQCKAIKGGSLVPAKKEGGRKGEGEGKPKLSLLLVGKASGPQLLYQD
jgi:hypothetical protein